MCCIRPQPHILCEIQIYESGLDLANENGMKFWFITFLWPSTALVPGEGENMLGNSADGTKGDLMVSGSNQEVLRASWWNRCGGGWWYVPKRSFPFSIPAIALSRSQGTKTYRDWESQVISFLCTNPALWHSSNLTLIPHLSEARTVLAFDSKPPALFGLHAPDSKSGYSDGLCITAYKRQIMRFKCLTRFNISVIWKFIRNESR